MGISTTGAFIDKIILPSGSEYSIVDAEARTAINNLDSLTTYSKFLGVTTTELIDGSTTAVIKINNENVTAAIGNIAIYQSSEFIFNGSSWALFGDLSAQQLGNFAYTSTATVNFTPAGTINTETGTVTFSGQLTPSGSINLSTTAQTFKIQTVAGVPSGATTGNYWLFTPEGNITTTVSLNSITALKSIEGNTLVSNITAYAPTATLPSGAIGYAGVTSHALVLFSIVPSTTGAIKSTSAVSVASSSSITATSQFTGNEVVISPISITLPTSATFTGTASTVSVTGTVINSVTFSGTPSTITIAAPNPS